MTIEDPVMEKVAKKIVEDHPDSLKETGKFLLDALESVANFLGAGPLLKRIEKWTNGGETSETKAFKNAIDEANELLRAAYGIKLPAVPTTTDLDKAREKLNEVKSHNYSLNQKSFLAKATAKQRKLAAQSRVDAAQHIYDKKMKDYEQAVNNKNLAITQAANLGQGKMNQALAETSFADTIIK